VNQAIERGVYFEIQYTAALHDAVARRNLISNAIALVNASKVGAKADTSKKKAKEKEEARITLKESACLFLIFYLFI
jgi:hypothetical protein